MHILIVEDDAITRHLLENKLVQLGYTVDSAQNGTEAWAKLNSAPFDMVISDWSMPEMDGLELFKRIRNADFKRYIYLILVTAHNTKGDIVSGLVSGADDYITKPINMEEFRARVEIGAKIVQLERKATDRYNYIKKNYFQTIHMFTNLIEVFDEELGGHCRRVGELSLKLAKLHPDVSENDLPIVEAAGLLHDIGMIGLPSGLLSKKRTEMNGDERQLYLSHPVSGEIILNEIDLLRPIAKLVRAHHEQYNGRGFPDGLDNSEIPLLAKIVSAASVYDNIVHKGKVSLENIPDSLQRLRGYQLDPDITDHLMEINLEKIQEEERKEFFELEIDDLQEGMMLAGNIRTKTGAFVMPANTQLTNNGIEKLKNCRKIASIGNKTFVYKWSVRG